MGIFIVILNCIHQYLGEDRQNRGIFDSEEKAKKYAEELDERIKQDEYLSESYCSIEHWKMNIPLEEEAAE